MFNRWSAIDGYFFDLVIISQDAAAGARTHVTIVI